jgi:hypothetical protein
VPQPRFERGVNAWLFRIDLPGVDVAHHGQPLAPGPAHAHPRVGKGKHSQIAAACNRKVGPTPETESRHRKLHDGAERCLDSKGAAWGVRDAVGVMFDRENTRVITKAELRQNVESPDRAARNRKTGRAVTVDRSACRLLDAILGA